MIGPAVITAFPDATGRESRFCSPSLLRRRPQICQSQLSHFSPRQDHLLTHTRRFILLVLFFATRTGMSMMQSSALQSLVTQCRNTVDIFWCLCFTNRKTSKEKRPIWLFPFSKTVVCESLEHLHTCAARTRTSTSTPAYLNMHALKKKKMTDWMSGCLPKLS